MNNDSDKNTKVENLANTFTEGLNSEELQKEVNNIAKISPRDILQHSILDLMKDQLNKASGYDVIIQKAIDGISARLDSNELDICELLTVVSSFSAKKLDIIKTIFAPLQGGSPENSLFLNTKDDDNDLEKGLKEMTPAQLKLMDKLMLTINNADEL